MDSTILTAFITSASTLMVCLINNFYQQKQYEKKQAETITLINYKLDELSKRVDKHNSIIERTYKLEEQSTVTDERIKVINHRLKDLEEREVQQHEN